MTTPTFHIKTLGCKVNQFESAGLAEFLRGAGWREAPKDAPADICIINTCTVTGKASMQARQAIRQIVRANPGARVVVTGCYAETEPNAIRAISGVDAVIGNRDKHRIPELSGVRMPETAAGEPAVSGADDNGTFHHYPVTRFEHRTRPFLKIQDGCDAYCTYCIVPYARGRSRSLPPGEVIANLKALKNNGYREVVLSGIHLGAYGLDLEPPVPFADLLKRLDQSGMPDRIRLSSIEPTELSDAIISFMASASRFCPHFHVPLQSGDDGVLKRMHRPYTAGMYRDTIGRIVQGIPDAGIGADVLIGFPGESDEAFDRTYALIEELPVAYLHVFPFSPREGTPASRFTNPVPVDITKARTRAMRDLGDKKRSAFFRRHLGSTMEVVVEGRRDRNSGLLRGLTGNYIPVLIDGEDHLMDTLVPVQIESVNERMQVYGMTA